MGVLLVRGKRRLKPLDLTRVGFSHEQFFHWKYQGPAKNNPIWVVGVPPCFIEKGVRISTECCIRMLDDVYLPHCMARLGTVARRRRLITHQPTHQGVFEGARHPAPHVASVLARLESTRFSLLARVGNSTVGERQFQSQLESGAMIVRAMPALDPEAADKACTTGFIHRCLACVRARGTCLTRWLLGHPRALRQHDHSDG